MKDATAQVQLTREMFYALYWDKVDDQQRAHVCSVATLPRSLCLLEWDELDAEQRDKAGAAILLFVEAHQHNRKLRPPAFGRTPSEAAKGRAS